MSAYLFFIACAAHQENGAKDPRANHDFYILRHPSWAKEFENWNLGKGWLTGKYNHLRISHMMFNLSLAKTFALTKQNILCFFSQVRTIHLSDSKVTADFSSHFQTFLKEHCYSRKIFMKTFDLFWYLDKSGQGYFFTATIKSVMNLKMFVYSI